MKCCYFYFMIKFYVYSETIFSGEFINYYDAAEFGKWKEVVVEKSQIKHDGNGYYLGVIYQAVTIYVDDIGPATASWREEVLNEDVLNQDSDDVWY